MTWAKLMVTDWAKLVSNKKANLAQLVTTTNCARTFFFAKKSAETLIFIVLFDKQC